MKISPPHIIHHESRVKWPNITNEHLRSCLVTFWVSIPFADTFPLYILFTHFSTLSKRGMLCTLCILMYRGAIIHYSLTLNKICCPMNQQKAPGSRLRGLQLQLSWKDACVDSAVTGAHAVTLLSIAGGVLAFCIRLLLCGIKIQSRLSDWLSWAVACCGAQFSDNKNKSTGRTETYKYWCIKNV